MKQGGDMAEFGEWNRKGATLSDAAAQKEYGISGEFIFKGMKSGDLEYREGEIWGNPYFRLLRSQLEAYIVKKLGKNYLVTNRKQAELLKIKKEMAALRKKLQLLDEKRKELESGG